jgi:hypothetical protein
MAGIQRRIERTARRPKRARVQRGRVLSALTTSTLALPGLAGSSELGDLGYTTEYRYSRYTEGDLPASKVQAGNEQDRMEIEGHQIHLGGPLTNRIQLDLDVAYEVMSGATPWYIEPDATTGKPLQVMTGSTVDDTRTDALLKGTLLFDRGTAALATGVSVENDYTSVNGGLSGERFFNEKNTTLAGGLDFSYDFIEPTDPELFNRTDEETKQTALIYGGLSQVLSKNIAVQTNLQYQFANGFLSDPYKRAYVDGTIENDSRPDMRHQFSWLTRYRHHIEFLRATLHADYRLFLDDWNVNAHTIELAWYQTLWQSFRLIPSFRYYTQSQADFYAPYYQGPRSDGYYSSDYRLAPFGAISWAIKAETRFQVWSFDWIANFSYQQYTSSSSLAIKDVSVENPGLLNYDLLSVGFTTKF